MTRSRVRRIRAASLVACASLVVVAGACRSTDPAFHSSEGKPLEDIAPVLYGIAVAPVDLGGLDLDGAAGETKGLHFSMSAQELQLDIVDVLRRLNASSAVYIVGDDALAEARAMRADLLVQPRLRNSASFRHLGISKRGFLTTVLWVTTWIGSFWVEDSSYDATLAVDFDIFNPNEGLKIDSISASSDEVDLTFLERNEISSWGCLESMILPPFWTRDDRAMTSRTLSRVASARLAARLTRYLKEDLTTTEKDFLGEVRLQTPANGADVGAVAQLKGKVIAKEAITALAVYLNDADVPVFEKSEESLPSVAEQRLGNAYQVFIDHDLALQPGRNLIAIEIGISGRVTSRTVVAYNGRDEPVRVEVPVQ